MPVNDRFPIEVSLDEEPWQELTSSSERAAVRELLVSGAEKVMLTMDWGTYSFRRAPLPKQATAANPAYIENLETRIRNLETEVDRLRNKWVARG